MTSVSAPPARWGFALLVSRPCYLPQRPWVDAEVTADRLHVLFRRASRPRTPRPSAEAQARKCGNGATQQSRRWPADCLEGGRRQTCGAVSLSLTGHIER